jgi:probable HAF family extracellular repeat protein
MRLLAGAVLSVLALAATTAPAAVRYEVIAMDAIPSMGDLAVARGLNDLGWMAGGYQSANRQQAFRWRGNGDFADAGAGNFEAEALNRSGQVVGYRQISGPQARTRAFSWNDDSGSVDLGSLDGDAGSSAAWDVNDSGEVVGSSSFGATTRAFVWTAATGMTDLGAFGSGRRTAAAAINEAGQVVGYGETATGTAAFAWDGVHGMRDIGALADQTLTAASGINDRGQVVGRSGDRAFLWDEAAGMVAIDTGAEAFQSSAIAINNAGQVIGTTTTDDGTERAFVWNRADGVIHLDRMLINGAGWLIEGAYDINALGQIVGYGRFEGEPRAFLLNPTRVPFDPATPGATVPEPATWAFLVLGFGLMGCAMRRRRVTIAG